MFSLTHGRFIVGYALGDDGMLFRGELLTDCDVERARQEAVELAEYWSRIDEEDEADPWHGHEPEEGESPTGERVTGGTCHRTAPPDTHDQTVSNHQVQSGATT